jgi:homoserine kinase
MMDENQITARAPGSVSNVCCGFDILGFALNDPFDEVTACFNSGTEIEISRIIGVENNLSLDPKKNIIGIVAKAFLDLLGSHRGVSLQLNKGMSVGTGLGSSAASATATAVALNALFDTPFTHEQLLEVALKGEMEISGGRHADNVAPALHGGLVLVKNNDPLDIYPIPSLLDLHCVVVHPDIEILTKASRNALSRSVALHKVIAQTSHIAGLILALTTGDRELLAKSLCDEIIEPQRYKQIKPYRAIKAVAQSHGALGCGISGSGPSMFALCDNPIQALELANAMEQVCEKGRIDCKTYISPLICPGARVVS